MLLFTFGFIRFDFSTLMSFLIGIVFGATILVLIYLYMTLKFVEKQKTIIKSSRVVNEDAIKIVIKNATDAFLDKTMQQDLSTFAHLQNICMELVYNIASVFFPDSKYPLLELSIDEILILIRYIDDRLEEIFSTKILRAFRKVKMSDIAKLNNVKKTVENTKIIKMDKKYNIMKKINKVKDAINVVNPVYWFRKIVINNSINIIFKKIGVVTINIVAEETYKIYSKNVFNENKIIDSNVNEILQEIEKQGEGGKLEYE